MRKFLIATAAVAAIAAAPAGAQTYRHGGGWSGGGVVGGGSGGGWTGGGWGGGSASASAQGGSWGGGWNNGGWNGQHWGGGRWGGDIGGRWYGGVRAPGGWNGYRRPQRGWAMPSYWRSPAWAVHDWRAYGLQAPPRGYGWSRYYDDAVLVDERGYVHDSVGGLDWRRADQPYATGYGYPGQGYYNAPGGDYYGRDPRCYEIARKRKGSGIGGAIVGGAIGAGIGAATGGLGAILLGGGLGGLTGQAIDRESKRRKVVCDGPEYGPGYGPGPGYDPGPDYGAGEDAYAYDHRDAGRGGAYHGYDHAAVTYAAPVTTTTTTTTVTEEWIYPRGRGKVVVRRVKPRSKVIHCNC